MQVYVFWDSVYIGTMLCADCSPTITDWLHIYRIALRFMVVERLWKFYFHFLAKKRRISHVTLKFDFCSWPWQVEINHYAKTTSKVISMKDRLIRELVRPRSRNSYAHLGHTNWPVIVRFLDRCPRNLPTKIWCGHSFLGLYLAKVSSGGSVAEWLASWTQAQKGLGSNRSRGAVG